MKTINLIQIWYIDNCYGEPDNYEATTDNFKKWLEDRNRERIADNQEPFDSDEFRTESICISIYDKIDVNP